MSQTHLPSLRRVMRRASRDRREATRLGFTLIELLVTILIISILAGLVLGALQRANGTAKIAHTKATIAKLNASLMDRWDSYRNRRLPVDPVAVLQNIKSSGGSAYPTLQARIASMVSRRAAALSLTSDPLAAPITSPLFPTNLQIAAVRLIAIRELMRFEMPTGFADFADMSTAPTPGVGWGPAKMEVLATLPPAATMYLYKLNQAYIAGATQKQITENEAAECLYMILTEASTDGGLFGEQLPTMDVGDVDGDGLPEFQDAWVAAMTTYAPKGQANSPIMFMRWAPGFISPVQPDSSDPNVMEFTVTNHDYFDPLKLDIPGGPGDTPRGFQLTPLIYSAGPDGYFELYPVSGNNDPYAVQSAGPPVVLAGSWNDVNGDGREAYSDNVTNHDLDTRAGK